MILISSTCFQACPLARTGLPSPGVGLELSGGMPWREARQWREAVQRFRETARTMVLVHNYFPPPSRHFVLNPASSDPEVLERSLALMRDALDLCRCCGAPWYSFHPGYLADGEELPGGHFSFRGQPFRGPGEALKAFHANFPRIHALARERGVALALENLFPAPDGARTSLACTLDDIEEMLAPLPRDVGLLLDLGHLNVSAHHLGFDRWLFLERLVERHGRRIYEIHLSANDGRSDQHLPLDDGDWQLDALALLRHCPGFGDAGVFVTLEARHLDDSQIARNVALIRSTLEKRH